MKCDSKPTWLPGWAQPVAKDKRPLSVWSWSPVTSHRDTLSPTGPHHEDSTEGPFSPEPGISRRL